MNLVLDPVPGLDPVPADVAAEHRALAAALDAVVPPRQLDSNLLIATWNIRAFGGLTDKWHAGDGDSPRRDLRALSAIAEVISRFDVVAVQEVRGDLRALRHALKLLGPNWGLILTDVTAGPQGNDERLAFLYDTRRVRPSGLACELVLPENGAAGAGVRQFARTPYAVSFLAGTSTFILVTLHVRYGEAPAERVAELTAIARWMADWAGRERDWGHNLLALGDFNIDRRGDALYEAFTSTGLCPPDELSDVPRTIFDDEHDRHFYDQIAWFREPSGTPRLTLRYTGRAGAFDFVPRLQAGATRQELSWQISDHYPLWAEFDLRSGA
jgi:endonuclease/exonuclease/phosphatase family metal-dependent hydrolase